MSRITKSNRYLLALAAVLLSIPVIGGLIINQRIKSNQYKTLESYASSASIIPVPEHSTLLIDSYEQSLTFYAWWNMKEDTLVAENFNDILSNKYYFRQELSGDTFSIKYLPVLKRYTASMVTKKSGERKKAEIPTTQISILGKAPQEMIIRGKNIQVVPMESTNPISYNVLEGSLSLGILIEDLDHFKNLTKTYPKQAIGINYQPDFENKIVSPATIHLAKHTSLFIKDGYNVAQTDITTAVNCFISIDHQKAHEQIIWHFADSTWIHCNKVQEAWFRKQFPDKKLVFTTHETITSEFWD